MSESGFRRGLPALGGLLAGLAVGLGAYASHAATGLAQQRLGLAALFLFGHGLALAALGRSGGRLAQGGLGMLLVGVLLFSGSLVGAAFFDLPTRLAPLGGMAMMLGWVLWTIAAMRGRS